MSGICLESSFLADTACGTVAIVLRMGRVRVALDHLWLMDLPGLPPKRPEPAPGGGSLLVTAPVHPCATQHLNILLGKKDNSSNCQSQLLAEWMRPFERDQRVVAESTTWLLSWLLLGESSSARIRKW